MDMRFYWIRDRVHQGMLRIYWAPGAANLADYFLSLRHIAEPTRLRRNS